MPRGDGTGPNGMGPMTGRGAGFCSGNTTGLAGRGFGRGPRRGCGRGPGRGFGMRNFNNFSEVNTVRSTIDETKVLKQHAENLSNELEEVKNRLEMLENSNTDKTPKEE